MALPTYTMSCFKLPKVLCKDISKMIATFWWGDGENVRKMHWTSWNKMSQKSGDKRVGNGKTIDIWQDKWIQGTEDERVKTRRDPRCTLRKVDELIADGVWNQEILNHWFIAEDVQKIKATPLSITGCQDRLYWQYTKAAMFTVKSTYDAAMETRQHQHMERLKGDSGSTSYDQQNSKIWKSVWTLKMKHKLKHFIWRCLHRSLPVNEQIHKRTGKGSLLCRSCGEEVETIEHMLFFCGNAETTWKLAPLQWDGLKELREGEKWRPPTIGTIKINSDAAFSQNMERIGIGVVTRNAEGELMKAWARAELKHSEPQVEEAVAIRMGMQMAWEANWKAVEFQSDCKEVVDMINKEDNQQTRIAIILEDIANMRCLFEQCTFSFVHRIGNGCAHSLAKFAVELTKKVEWEVCFPMWLHERAQNEYRGSNSNVSKSCSIKL
ncbi:uncharacterized protein [Coffea arabica]|uniref:Uncharacterized protein n=1 Tax=Coffea arabica TaxID=13443 RepID=A0ABM4VZH4_COFAR